MTPNADHEVAERVLLQVLADLPDDRSTPLDGFVAESLLKKKAITKDQLLESINACKSSPTPVSLFQAMHSRNYISDADIDALFERYKQQLQEAELSEIESDITFGEIAVQKKHTTKPELWAAIEEQERRRVAGSEHRLGEILVNRGTLTISQAKDILDVQGKRILHCPACGDQYNVSSFSADKEYTCLSCGGELSDTGEVASLEVKGTAYEKTITSPQPEEDRFVGKEIGSCKILSKIGEGGMGAVYKAHHLRLKRTVAVKIMSAALLGEIHRKRFLREARAAAQLDHPNIMIVHDVDEFEGSPFIIMQHIDGKTVGEILDAKGKVAQVDAVRIILEAAQALDAAHQRNIVHRDIKPDNIMLTQSGQVKVMDFGLAKRTGSEQEMGVTATGVILGTPLYMSPEQFNAEVLDGRSDIYSLGVTFYHMVAGRPPFTGKTPYELRDHHMKTPPPSPRKYSPELSPSVCTIIDRMLAKDKEDRYRSSAELVKDLKDAIADLTTEPTVAAEPAKGKGFLKYLIAASVIAAAIVILLLVIPRGGQQQPDTELEKRASEVYAAIKPKLVRHLVAKEYITALGLLNTFTAELADTGAGKKVESDKIEVMRLIIAHFEEMLKDVNEKIASRNFGDATERSRILAELAREIKTQISEMPKTGEMAKLASQAEERAAAAESTSKEISQYDQLESLVREGKLGEAKSLLTALDIQNPELRSQAEDISKEIERLSSAEAVEAEKKRWEAAKKAAYLELEAKRFDAADVVITNGKYERSPVEEVKAQATALRIGIAQKRKDFEGSVRAAQIDSDIEKAQKLLDSWKLSEARERLLKYHDDETVKYRITPLLSGIDSRLAYLADAAEAERLISLAEKSLASPAKCKEAQEKIQKHLTSEDAEIARRAKEVWNKAIPVLYPDMVYFASGDYKLGNTLKVKLEAFYIDKHEVTNKQYAEFLRATSRPAPSGWKRNLNPNLPVTGVSYDDAVAYAKWAGKRLPTEEEWEVAASWEPDAKKNLTYPWGDKFDARKCVFRSSAPKPIGSNPGDVSPCGVHDMAGNVYEWTSTRDGKNRVVRGGSWADYSPKAARCDSRSRFDPKTRSSRLGFRCAKDAQE